MKTEDEIQRAHDLLHAFFATGKIPLSKEVSKSIMDSLAVLCWILDHRHGGAFTKNLARLEAFAGKYGFFLTRIQ